MQLRDTQIEMCFFLLFIYLFLISLSLVQKKIRTQSTALGKSNLLRFNSFVQFDDVYGDPNSIIFPYFLIC